MSAERQRGFYEAADKIMNFINSLDSSNMTAKQVRTAIYAHCLEMRPPK